MWRDSCAQAANPNRETPHTKSDTPDALGGSRLSRPGAKSALRERRRNGFDQRFGEVTQYRLTGKDVHGNNVEPALKVVAEAGSVLNVKLIGLNESKDKSLTADASGITAITLTANEYAALGVGQASVQVSATDLAGNVSMLAFTDFKVL